MYRYRVKFKTSSLQPQSMKPEDGVNFVVGVAGLCSDRLPGDLFVLFL